MECQHIHLEVMTKLEIHHLATSIVINSTKKHQWMLKLVGESLNRIEVFFRCMLTESEFPVEKPGRH